ncbi:MAG: 50S ribosomal protein L11 methyltransferase [Alphaproteobacteria bacterium]
MIDNIFNKQNPFKQTNNTWLLKFIVEYQYLEVFTDRFEHMSETISSFEYDASPNYESAPQDKWMLEIYFDHEPERLVIKLILQEIAASLNTLSPEFSIEKLEDQDWVSKVQEAFKAFAVGKFFIYSSFYKNSLPTNKHLLLIDPGRAFGTGEHETTTGCLMALSELSKKYKFYNMLDMGCGTGVLAIAMAKLWKNRILALDIDSEAVKITNENIKRNMSSEYIYASVSNGYSSKKIKQYGKFDLITANILAKPLIKFAPDLKNSLAEGGIAVLSGLLSYQEKSVIKAHIAQKLTVVKIIRRNNWSTIILHN